MRETKSKKNRQSWKETDMKRQKDKTALKRNGGGGWMGKTETGGEKERQHETRIHGDTEINREEDRDRNESVFPAPPHLPALLSAGLHSCTVLLFLIFTYQPVTGCHGHCYCMWLKELQLHFVRCTMNQYYL